MAANSDIWIAGVLSQIALAPAAGIIYATFGPGLAFGLNSASSLTSAAVLAGLHLPSAPYSADGRAWLPTPGRPPAARQGSACYARWPRASFLSRSSGATSALLVVLAADHLDQPPSADGLLLAAIAVGALLGSVLLTRFVRDPLRPAFVFGPYLLRGTVDLVLASIAALPLALFAYGLGTSTGAVTFTSLVQHHTRPDARGRVLAGFDLIWQLGLPRLSPRPLNRSTAP